MSALPYVFDDGGREAAGFKGSAGDCVARAIAIASGEPYATVYAALAAGTGAQPAGRRGKRAASARNGINTKRTWFKAYMHSMGFEWVACMGIGTGCKVHLVADELPLGRLVVHVSKHATAVIDGVIRDTFDPSRTTHWMRTDYGVTTSGVSHRCVYGYWLFTQQ